jgi:3-phenylpropionate/trans-cinnamate dioxygenase ferredoxin subunit
MAGYVTIGKVSEFEDGVIYRFDVEGEYVAVVSWRDRFYAFSDHCTHWGVSLSQGYITGADEIVCMYHFAAFDMKSGAVLDGPAMDDLPLYEVRVEGEDVLVSTSPVIAN